MNSTDNTDNTDVITAEFTSAVAVARHALAEFRKEPLVLSKRGGPRTSPWFRVWKESSEIAQRWLRQMGRDQRGPSFDDELDRLLSDGLD